MQQKAIEKNWNMNANDDWFLHCYEMTEEMAEFFGIDTAKKSFCFDLDRGNSFGMDSRLSFSSLRAALQGKPEAGYKAQEELFSLFGAWYKAAAKKVCPQTWKVINEGCNPYATSETRNTDASFCTVPDSGWECDRVAADLDILAELCEDVLKHICHFAVKMLREEYDYQTSEEQVRESLIANEYEFEADGDGSIF